jgi:C-terminal processing protease CtpA/Prc
MKRLFFLGAIATAVLDGSPDLVGQTELPPVVVEGRPLGKFGFGTGTGGAIWDSRISHLVINHIVAGGPADKAGLRLDDEILSIDGLSVPGRARKEVFAALRSKEAGQLVDFRVMPRNGSRPPHDVKVRAEKVD